MEWFKTKLYGKRVAYNSVYYAPKPPNPKKGWLRKTALMQGDLWFDTAAKTPKPHAWSDGRWKKLGTD